MPGPRGVAPENRPRSLDDVTSADQSSPTRLIVVWRVGLIWSAVGCLMSNIVRVVVMREGRRVVRFRRRPSAEPLPAGLPLPVKPIERVVTARVRRLRADLRYSLLRIRARAQRFRLRRVAQGVHRATWWWTKIRRSTWLPAWLLDSVLEKVRRSEAALRDVLLMPLDRWCWWQKCLAERGRRRVRPAPLDGAAS